MVKRDVRSSVTEDNGEVTLLNENGKRSSEDQNTDDKKRVKTKSLYRQPTVNELNRLQETENLFNSNLFRLQVDEILAEVKLKEKTEKKFAEWFIKLKTHLQAIPENYTEYDLTAKQFIKHLKVKLPLNSELKKTKCVFKFHKFKDVEVVGSYALGCPINSKLIINVQIIVPAETYTKNDSINYRYHKKRAAYLAYIASHLTKLDIIDELKYCWLNGCETKAVLNLKPIGKLGNHLSVHINLVCEEEAYKLHRFSPMRNNLRESWVLSSDYPEGGNEVGPPTSYYNSSILSDLTATVNQDLLKETLVKSENLKQAVVLLKIWIRQRNLQVSGHVVSLLVAYYVQMKRINNIMSSYQIIRNVWIALQASELDTKGISLYKGQDPTPSLEEFHQHFPIVFIDRTGYYNICWQMCKGTYNALKRECALAIGMLDNSKIYSFIPLFMTPVKPLNQFDHILRFKNFQNLKEAVLNKVPKEAKINYGVEHIALVTDTVYSLLVKGLGDRVDLILQLVDADFSWSVKKSPEKMKKLGYEENLSYGFILNGENCISIVEKGPPANLPEAEEFRKFWGDKSELRRFQDGSITETCVWDGESMAERRGISKQIVDYLMNLKFGIPSSEMFHVCDQLDSLTARKQVVSEQVLRCEESSLRVHAACAELRRDLRQLTRLPLDITALYGVSSVFSYSCPLPALPCAAPRSPRRRAAACLLRDTRAIPEYTPVCKAIVELGHSGKWPGDIEAFRCLKAAFNLQIAECLTQQYSLPTQAYPTHIDVLKNGLVFRLVIAHPKEITLLRRETVNGVVKYKESEESLKLQCDTVLMPRLRGALHGLHQKHPAFGPTACLFKRWLSAHLLSPPHFPAIIADLLTAAVFAHAHPTQPPTQPSVGFVRVLRLLAETDWSRELIVLDINDDLTREEITDIEQKFNSDPTQAPCMRIVTAYDGALPAVWSRTAPTPEVLKRARVLAISALKFLEKALLEDMKDNILGAFVPSLTGYDVLIHLRSSLVPNSGERVDRAAPPRRVADTPAGDVIPVVEFHPVLKYLDELRSAYTEFALFFHDLYGGEVITVLWKPDVGEYKEFQVSNASALTPVNVKGETKYKVNTAALVEDFRILGDGLVTDITVIQ